MARDGYLAGSDAVRAEALAKVMTDPTVDAIVCARGGYGAMRVLDDLPWDAFARAPKWIVGFSDVTALHAAANARAIASVHGPNVTGLGAVITPAERASFIDALEARAPSSWEGLTMLREGRAEGPVVGGNLALVEAMTAARRFEVPEGAIVVLEDVTERPYRVDRMLTSLRLGGAFDRASAIVFGQFTACDPGPDGVTLEDVLRTWSERSSVPVAIGAPFGHGAPNHAFVLGRTASLEDGILRFR